MICEKCKKNTATVRMQNPSSNGSKTDLLLCEDCSADFEITVLLHHLLGNILGKIQPIHFEQIKNFALDDHMPTCSNCGITIAELKKSSNLGCAACYQFFADVLNPLLKNAHGSNTHEGKFPKRAGAPLKRENQISKLRYLMQQSVKEEDFDRAAFFRDKIKQLDTLPMYVDEEIE